MYTLKSLCCGGAHTLTLPAGRAVWALCQQADRGRVEKGSIETLIIDKNEGEGDGGE